VRDGTFSISGCIATHLLQLWKFVATFRSRCKTEARAVAKQHYSALIWPKLPDDRGTNQEEYQDDTRHNVTALLTQSYFHQKGRDAQVFLLTDLSMNAKRFYRIK
jgi:hypothetical protein